MVHRAARNRIFRSNCLKRSLLLLWRLRLQGIPAELKIGVGKQADTFQAHAWIEVDKRPLRESPTLYDQYRPFDQDLLPARVKWH